MNVLVDTPIWSAAMRRGTQPTPEAAVLAALIRKGRAELVGPVRQEVLSGIRNAAQFQRVRQNLRAFLDAPILTNDYEQAAEYFNTCRQRGIQGSHIDFLLCAVAIRKGFELYTDDADFSHYARYLPLTLHRP